MQILHVSIQIAGREKKQFSLAHSQTIETADPLAFVAAIKAVLDAHAPPDPENPA